MPLHLDYRPPDLQMVVGNKSVIKSLESVLDREDKPHAYLFTGPYGCGKTTLARIVVSLLKCSTMDFQEINSANSRGIESIRAIQDGCQYQPLEGDVKVYLLDEAHQYTGAAANALLKLLEDPPPHVYFILASAEPDKIPKSVRDRCHPFEVSPLLKAETEQLLKEIIEAEDKTVSDAIINEIVRVSQGVPRVALVLLDTVIDMDDEKAAIDVIKRTVLTETTVKELCQALLNRQSWKTVRVIISNLKEDPEKIRNAILGYMTAVVLNSDTNDRAAELIEFFREPYYNTMKAGLVSDAYSACQK
jgi:DNA polymerase III subunit gamma/tau